MMHTPGPWDYDEENGFHNVGASAFVTLGDDRKQQAEITGSRRKTNARLIAAAPELLAALRECITDDDCRALAGEEYSDLERARRRLHEINRVVRAAITKATGA